MDVLGMLGLKSNPIVNQPLGINPALKNLPQALMMAKRQTETIPLLGNLVKAERLQREAKNNLNTQLDTALTQSGYNQFGPVSSQAITYNQLPKDLRERQTDRGLMMVSGLVSGLTPKQSISRVVPTKQLVLGDDFTRAMEDVSVGVKSKSKLPILATRNKNGMYEVIDGNHRLADLMRGGEKQVEIITNEPAYRKLAALEETLTGNPSMYLKDKLGRFNGSTKGFRAVNSSNKSSTLGTGTYLANTANEAKIYGNKVKEIKINPEAKIFKVADSQAYDNLVGEAMRLDPQRTSQVLRQLGDKNGIGQLLKELVIKKGYVGIDGSEVGLGKVIFNPGLLK